jgi:hypothetical protein
VNKRRWPAPWGTGNGGGARSGARTEPRPPGDGVALPEICLAPTPLVSTQGPIVGQWARGGGRLEIDPTKARPVADGRGSGEPGLASGRPAVTSQRPTPGTHGQHRATSGNVGAGNGTLPGKEPVPVLQSIRPANSTPCRDNPDIAGRGGLVDCTARPALDFAPREVRNRRAVPAAILVRSGLGK